MQVQAGEIYKHFKNGYVFVLGLAKHYLEDESYVIYKGLNDNKMFCRALSSFTENVKTENNVRHRFSLASEEDIKSLISTKELIKLKELTKLINN